MGPIESAVNEILASAVRGTAIEKITNADAQGVSMDVMDDLPERDRYAAVMSMCFALPSGYDVSLKNLT